MRLHQLERKIAHLLTFEDPPELLVIHCGGNDIGFVKSIILRNNVEKTLKNLQMLLPCTKIVWSQILPRLSWRPAIGEKILNKVRMRLNRFGAKTAII